MVGYPVAAERRLIVLDSEPGRTNRVDDRAALPAPVAGPVGLARARPPSVLVVDDETQIVEFLCLLLEDEGYRALRAYDGVQAWALVRAEERPPDLVITDVMMPRMTGTQLVQRLREQLNGTCPPVIVMSAVTRITPPPGVRFLPKPFDIEQMLDLVVELTGR